MDQDTTWRGGRLGPGHIELDGDPAPPMERGTAAPSTFRPMSIVAKRLPISGTAKLLCFGYTAYLYMQSVQVSH